MDQFVAAFHRFCDAQTVFISTLNPRSVGLETAFSIDLADHTPALRGVGVVLQSWGTPQNPYGRPGLQLGIRRLTADSEPVFDRLLFAREAMAKTPTEASKIMPVFVAKPGVKRPLASTQQMPFGALKPASTPPPEPEPKTDVSPDPAIVSPLADGERTPGSDLVLPANPLMNISDHSLEGFVDCTLYEETGNFFGEQPVVEDPDDPVAAPPLLAPRRATTTPPQATKLPTPPTGNAALIVSRPPEDVPSLPSLAPLKPQAIGTKPLPIINKLTPPMGATSHAEVEFAAPGIANRTVPIKTLELANDIAGRMTPPPLDPPPAHTGPPPIPGKPWVSPETAELLDIEPDPPSVAQPMPTAPHTEYPAYNAATHASGTYDAVPAPPPYTPAPAGAFPVAPYRAPNDQRRRWVIGTTAGATVLIAIALLTAGHGKKTPAATATPPPAPKLLAANTEHARMAPTIPDKPVADATSSEPEPAEEASSGVVGKGPCKVAVSTTPAGSMISFDGEQLGPSPLTVAGPCTRRKIDIIHPRYAPAERFITPKPDDALDVTLVRPTHNLFIETQPAGAIVSIDGHRAGTTPTMVKIMGFTTIDIAIAKPGYKPTTKKLYSKTASDRVSLKLTR